MKNKFLRVLMLFLSISLLQAQTQRFFYAYQGNISTDPSRPAIEKDMIVLDVNPKEVYSYSHAYIINDSLVQTTHMKKLPSVTFKKIIKYKKGDKIVEHIQPILGTHYHIEIPKISNWKLLPDSKKIGPYTVKKAQVQYGGRQWNAWYCPEIPLPYGPYLFYGLPGLIIEIADDKSQYSFSLLSNKNIPETVLHEKSLVKYLGYEEVKMKEKDWKKFLENNYQNPLPGLATGEFMMRHDNGKEFTAQDYQEEIKKIQKQLLLYNNPLELTYKLNPKK